MVSLNVKHDFSDVFKKLHGLQQDVKDKVTARTLNRIGDSVKTQAVREISTEFNITASKVRERIHVRKAFAKTNLSIEIGVQSKFGRRATNLITFGAKPKARGGVNVKIKRGGRSAAGRKWFIITNSKTGGTFVAKRVGKARADIESVTTIDVGQMFNVKKINAKLLSTVRQKFPEEFNRQLEFALSRFNK